MFAKKGQIHGTIDMDIKASKNEPEMQVRTKISGDKEFLKMLKQNGYKGKPE